MDPLSDSFRVLEGRSLEVPFGKICGGIALVGIDRQQRRRAERGRSTPWSTRKLLPRWLRRDLFARLTSSCGSSEKSGAGGDSACKVGYPSTGPALGWVLVWKGVFHYQCIAPASTALRTVTSSMGRASPGRPLRVRVMRGGLPRRLPRTPFLARRVNGSLLSVADTTKFRDIGKPYAVTGDASRIPGDRPYSAALKLRKSLGSVVRRCAICADTFPLPILYDHLDIIAAAVAS